MTHISAALACALALSLAGAAAWAQGSGAALDEAALVNVPSDHASFAAEIGEPASAVRATTRPRGSANVDLISPPSDEVAPLVPKARTRAAKSPAPKAAAGAHDTNVASLPVQSSPTLRQATGAALGSAVATAAGGTSAAAKAPILPPADDRDGPTK